MNYLVRIAHLLMIFQFVILNAHNSFVILNARCLEKGRAFTFTIGTYGKRLKKNVLRVVKNDFSNIVIHFGNLENGMI